MPHDRRPLLRDSSDPDDFSTPTRAGGPSPQQPPQSPARHRPGYTRLASMPGPDGQTRGAARDEEGADIADTFHAHSAGGGLGIATGLTLADAPRKASVPRVAVAAKSPATPSTPASGDGLLATPGSARHVSSSSGLGTMFEGSSTESLTRGAHSHHAKPSVSSLQSEFTQPHDYPDDARLRSKKSATTVRSAYEDHFHPEEACPAQGSFHVGRTNWLAVVLMILSIYSTVFSGIYVAIAFKGPRYLFIRTKGVISPSSASLLTAVVAKTIELSFVTVFVAFLGQVLSRRAVSKRSKGVTLAEMSMRSWIMQPGTMLTHWETVRYAAVSFLGLVSLLAAVMAMLYTSASDALVAPQLKFGPWEHTVMQGRVQTQFSNPGYLAKICKTPIKNDESVSGTTCLQIEHAAQGYHNYQRYLTYWTALAGSGNGTRDLRTRPQGFGLLHENTSITAAWVEVADVAKDAGGRIINNVSLAMPHAGIFQAAREPLNGILQPEDLSGLGIYSIKASVPSPVLHVLCANVSEKDLEPIVYELWPGVHGPVDMSQWPRQVDFNDLNHYRINTTVDNVFGWGERHKQRLPLFPRLPIDYNTVLNHTGDYGPDSIYLLGKGGPAQNGAYVLCSLKAKLTEKCSTEYNVTGSGGTLEAHCEDEKDELAYVRSVSNASREDAMTHPNLDWPNIASEWGNSLSLNAGVNDANASNSRLLTQLILQNAELNPALPSVAEALAVMGGCTLLVATEGSPFVGFWNYSSSALETPHYQYFNASIRAQQFASGGVFQYQRGFYVVLFFVFITNALVLVYFLLNDGLVTDFSEPQNLFSLAVNSPPSHLLAGSCGCGPKGDQYIVNWSVNQEQEHLYMESEEPPGFKGGAMGKKRVDGIELEESPISRMYSKLSKRRSRL